jgi:arylsulfatase A-like enzyme
VNVVFLVMDTVRRDFLSPYNKNIEYTENIKEISRNATVFQNAVSQAPWTLPSHASMFTGLYPWEHGATQTNFELDVEKELLAEKLRKEGYNTASFSANPFISEKFGTAKGFGEKETTVGLVGLGLNQKLDKAVKAFEEKIDIGAVPKIEKLVHKISYRLKLRNDNDTDVLMDKAEDFIDENEENDFFLFMNLMDCHLPLFPDREYKDRHAEDVNPAEVNQYPHRVMHSDEKEIESEALKKLYRAQIDYLDDQIGHLVSLLRNRDVYEDTMLVIVGDHGENLGEEGLMGHSFSVNENLIHVPLIVKSPSLERGEVKKQVELRELYSLIQEQTGLLEDYGMGTKYAKGGEDRPEMDLAKTPPSEREKYDKKKYFVRTREKKGIITGEGFSEITLEEGDEFRSSVVKKKAEGLAGSYDESSGGKKVESVDEEVKDELKKLGYMQKE